MTKGIGWGLVATALLWAASAQAQDHGDLLRQHLYAGTIAQGLEEFAPLAGGDDPEAAFAYGVLSFMGGFERLARTLYVHGVTGMEAGPLAPELAVPIPRNPDPEPLDYAGVRAMLETFVSDMDTASERLRAAGEAGDYVVELDPLLFRLDIDGDGVGSDAESAAMLLGLAGDVLDIPDQDPELAPPPIKNKTGAGAEGTPALAGSESLFGFDRADAIWMAGYGQVFATQADYLLAHDFSPTVNATFHRFFPEAGFPLNAEAGASTIFMDPATDTAIADIVAMIHTANWPVIDPERLASSRIRMLGITALSRANWDAIEAETDDRREFMPSPRQTPIVPEARITAEMVAAWRKTLDIVDQILEGDLLVPHWRFRQGVDLRAYFDNASRTDFVMLLTGFDALPYLREGPIADAQIFAEANAAFGGNLLGYALWFN